MIIWVALIIWIMLTICTMVALNFKSKICRIHMNYHVDPNHHAGYHLKARKWSSRMSQYLSIHCLSHVLLFELIYYTIIQRSQAVRIIGTWNSRNSRFSILAKFGFQQIDPLDAEHSRGFIYGNVSSEIVDGGNSHFFFFFFRFCPILND